MLLEISKLYADKIFPSGSYTLIVIIGIPNSMISPEISKVSPISGCSLSSVTIKESAKTCVVITGEMIVGKIEGTNFTDSLLLGHATTGTLDAAEDNTGVGINALESLTSGDKNTALGHQAGKAITTASQNVYLGNLAGYQNTSSNFNIGIGDSALAGSDGSTASNVAIGALALNVASGANFNIAIGRDAGREVTTGDNNIFIGYNSGANDSTAGITTGSGNVIIGQVDPDSRTNNRQLKITGNDGSSSTTWISGDSSGIVTFADDIKIKDDGTIGSASAATAMTIESSGQVNFVGDINVADDVFMSSD